ncbi:MAG: DUF1365 domain-containing protein [Phycisphaeraceae bacterium]|nr:DUF1365 domain-containing protein [Phycisphaeraceae bacterium]
MRSAIYEGVVRHRRYQPKAHALRYRLFMLALDLDELDTVFKGPGRLLWSVGRWNIACLLRKDHFGGPRKSIKEAVLDRVEEEAGRRPTGRVVMLAHLRTFGYVMNPATFFYCYNKDGHLAAIAVEIHNTPWGERHVYVLPIEQEHRDKKSHRFQLAKRFHVSPFLPMDHDYDWRFNAPASGPGDPLIVSMKNLDHGRRVFDASLSMTAKPITSARLNLMLLKHPLITVKVVAAIYWNALLLWLKRVPFVTHPKWSDEHRQ